MRAECVADAAYHYFSLTSESPDAAVIIRVTGALTWNVDSLIVTTKPGSGEFEVIVYNDQWEPSNTNVPGADDPFLVGHFYPETESLIRGSANDAFAGFYQIASTLKVSDVVSVVMIPRDQRLVSVGVRMKMVSM